MTADRRVRRTTGIALALLAAAAIGCWKTKIKTVAISGPIDVPADIRAAVDAPDRSDADRALDAGRHPDQMLAFFGIHRNMKIAELMAGSGYTTELMARVIGPNGTIFAQNNKLILTRFAAKPWSERLAKPVMANVSRVDRELDSPLPYEARFLDGVVMVLNYHDAVWLGTDRAAMNKAVFTALRPGGFYAIVDHSARAGAGASEAQTLHRIEESVVRQEVEAAGFQLAKTGDFLRNPSDPRDWNASPSAAGERRGTSDRFALVFVKPS